MSNIEIKRFHAVNKGNLVGFVDIFIPSIGIMIRDIVWFNKEGRQWFNLPSEKYTDEDGAEKYKPYIVFPDKKVYEGFQDAMRREMGIYVQSH